MDYKKMIIELLDKVQNQNTLKRVYKLLEYLYLREGQQRKHRAAGAWCILSGSIPFPGIG